MDDAGNLYGTTIYGGDLETCWVGPSFGCGVVFKRDASGKETVLYTFRGGKDGGYPYGGLVRDAEGYRYGTTNSGGDLSACSGFNPGCGVVFKLDPAGKESVLYTFSRLAYGRSPTTGLVAENAGDSLSTSYALYGVTPTGGDLNGCSGDGCGVVFKITLPRASAQVRDPSP